MRGGKRGTPICGEASMTAGWWMDLLLGRTAPGTLMGRIGVAMDVIRDVCALRSSMTSVRTDNRP